MKFLTFLLTYILIQFVKPDCTEPPTLQNGTSSGCLSEGGQYQFSCDYPYTLNGRMTRLCLDGRWTGVQPTCELVTNLDNYLDVTFDSEYQIIPSFRVTDQYYRLCWKDYSLESASVVCRQVGRRDAASIHKVDLDFGLEVKGPYFNVESEICSENATHLDQCLFSPVSLVTACTDGILGISCYPYSYLEYSTTLDRIQMYYENEWFDVCVEAMDQTAVDNFCKIEGYVEGGVISSVNGTQVTNQTVRNVTCSQEMRSFSDCVVTLSNTCQNGFLKIDCLDSNVENSLRLTGADDLHTGKLQIYKSGSWGDICWEAFYAAEAAVACVQLGFETFLAYPRGVYGDRVGDSYAVERVSCPAGAVNFSSCQFLSERRCSDPEETVGIWCINRASCCLPTPNSTYLQTNSSDTVLLHGAVLRYSCTGNTVVSGSREITCQSGTWSGQTPTCVPATENATRIVDGPNAQEGNIQVFISNSWSYICDRNWGISIANTFCEDLGYEGAIAITKFNYYNSTPSGQPISSVECTPECVSLDCAITETAGVMCGDLQFEVRLVGSDVPTRGRAQLFYGGHWLELCQDLSSFFLQNGPTVCNQLGYGYATTFSSEEGIAMFGEPDTNETISALCFGVRTKVEDCSLSFFPCSTYGLYLACTPPDEGSLRLEGSKGVIEIYQDYSWKSICKAGWDDKDGEVACTQLGWESLEGVGEDYGPALSLSGFGITLVGCLGNESSITECPHETDTNSCDRANPATLNCSEPVQYQVRLVETIEYEFNTTGLVEVYVGKEWLGVCDDGWGFADAMVVCRSLGFDYAIASIRNYASVRTTEGWNHVDCNGSENLLGDCTYRRTSVYAFLFADCVVSEGAGVTCGLYVPYSIRIRESTLSTGAIISGTVEILYESVWLPICYEDTENLSEYLCSQLGHGEPDEVATPGEPITTTRSFNNFPCSGTQTIEECNPPVGDVGDCPNGFEMQISCVNEDGRLRLVDGNDTAGHVQVYHEGIWGDVCDDRWGILDATVVCRQLLNRGALKAISYSTFGTRAANFLLDNVNCDGTEDRLVDCDHNGWGLHNCGGYELAGVQCLPDDCLPLVAPANGLVTQDLAHGGFASFSCLNGYKLDGDKTVQCLWSEWTDSRAVCVLAVEGDIQLVDGPSSYEGHVQIFHNSEWGYVCDDGWDVDDGRVVCTQLGIAPNIRGISTSSFYTSDSNITRIWLDGVNCVGDEAMLADCVGADYSTHDCNEIEYAGVECYADEGRLRLLGGLTEYDGLLQMYLNGTWSYFCNFEFVGGIRPACTQLGYQTTGSIVSTAVTTSADFMFAFCSPAVSSLYTDCTLGDVANCLNNFAVNLTCAINDRCEARLLGDYKGLVEFWRNGRWGGVCNGGFTNREADILCHQLGWEKGAKYISFDVTEAGAIPFHFHNVSCSEGDTDICECALDTNVGDKCTRNEAVYVECLVPLEGTLRLVGEESPYSGVLEVFHDRVWGSVCDDAWTPDGSSVACKQLGTPGYISYSIRGTVATRLFWLDNVRCMGDEEFLSNCTHNGWGNHNCGGQEGVVLECDSYVNNGLQLTDITYSDDNLFARVQLFRDDEWYNLCPTDVTAGFANQLCVHFNLEDTILVSRPLVLDAPTNSVGTINLLSCPFEFDNYTQCMPGGSCTTDQVLGLQCLSFDNQTRLITETGYSGIIEINHEGSWRGICDDGWGLNDATVACKQLGFKGAVRAISALTRLEAEFWLTLVVCGGHESYLDHCSFGTWNVASCSRFEYAGIVCTPENCTSLPTISSGAFAGNLTHGSNIILQCSDGYVVRGSRILMCINGDWIGDMPTCNLPQEFSLRLIDTEPEDFYKGHVQIYHLGQWGYICDLGWDGVDGETACIQLGFQGFQQITRQSYHSNVTGMSWTDNVACNSGDRSFAECGIRFNNSVNCMSFAGVQCVTLEGHVQLINGNENGTGLIRIYKQGEYRAVCYDYFGPEEVSVVCRQLGYPRGVATPSVDVYTMNSELKLVCYGTEGQVRDCVEFEVEISNCRRFDVFINCSYEDQYAVRFVEGTTSYEGQLEVYIADGWSSVCYGVDNATAAVVCNLLGWEYGVDEISAVSTTTELGIQVNISSCPVHAEDLNSCEIKDTGVVCERDNALNIQCNLPAQNTLRRGHNNALEIFHDDKWGYVCDDLFDKFDADVACRQLGYPNATSYEITTQVLSNFFWLDNLDCRGYEFSLADCVSNDFGFENCYAREGVVVECSQHYEGLVKFEGDIPLVFIDEAFHYICAAPGGFSILSASVICNQEGRVEAKSVGSYPVGTNGVKLQPDVKSINCIGYKNAVKDCVIQDETQCVSIANMQCVDPTGYIRLEGGSSSSGTVQIHNGTEWQYICPDKWSYQDAEIACGQLYFDLVRDFGSKEIDKEVTYYASGFDCYGDEDRLIDCINVIPPNCSVDTVATLSCRTSTCPISSELSSCVTCVPSCYGEVNPTNCNRECEEKCECLQGYIWNTADETLCIRESQCPNFCSDNELYFCVPACQDNCVNYKDPALDLCSSLPCTFDCGCKPGYVRKHGIAGECVLEADCEATTQTTQVTQTTPSVTTATPTFPACPANSKYTNCSCLANCSSADCIPECIPGCQCDTGYVWLLGNCIETDKCPAEGSIEIQSSTSHTHTASGPIHLFIQGGWYNICSDAFDKETYLIELTCDFLNYSSTVENKYSTSQAADTAVSLTCPQGAESVFLCDKELKDCESILILVCESPVAVTGSVVAVVIGVALGLLVLLALVVVLLGVVAIFRIRKRNQKNVYKQFNARLSVVSDVTEPIDDPTGIANPIYQTKDLETEQLISDDEDVLAS